MKHIIPVFLIFALIGALLWLIYAPDFEPVVTSIALLASLLSIYFDRIIAEKDRKKEILRALANELYLNIEVLKNLKLFCAPENINKPHIYPRFYISSLSNAISSGIFTGKKDKLLWKLMNSWLQRSNDYNNRLTISEINVFSNISLAAEFNNKLTSSKVALISIESFLELQKCVYDKYSKLTGINNDTQMFESD